MGKANVIRGRDLGKRKAERAARDAKARETPRRRRMGVATGAMAGGLLVLFFWIITKFYTPWVTSAPEEIPEIGDPNSPTGPAIVMTGPSVEEHVDVVTRRMVEESKVVRREELDRSAARSEMMGKVNAAKQRYDRACEFAARNPGNGAAQAELSVRVNSSRGEVIKAVSEYRQFLVKEEIWDRMPESQKKSIDRYLLELRLAQSSVGRSI